VPFPRLTPKVLFERRNAYGYPAVALTGAPATPVVLQLATTTAMDNYLNGLLRSRNDDEVVLGYLGVIFWGHYSGQTNRVTEERARGKVSLAHDGATFQRSGKTVRHAGIASLGVPSVAAGLRAASVAIGARDFAGALQELFALPQLSVAFASKVCAFMDPTRCGVIDSALVAKYPLMPFGVNKGGYVKVSKANRSAYSAFCCHLQSIAQSMNRHPLYSQWIDRDGKRHPWRAVDVERALY